MRTPTEDTDVTDQPLQLVEEVRDPNAGTVFTTGRKLALVGMIFPFLLLFFAGIVFTAEALANLFLNDAIYIRLTRPDAFALLAAGTVALAVGIYLCCYNQQLIHNLTYRSLICRAIADRETTSVRHDDPDAMYVKWTPREQWHEVMVDDAADIGLLLIDRTHNTLVFEGDRYRHTVPCDLIIGCRTEFGGMFFEPFTLVVLDLPEDYTDVPELCYEYRQPRGPFSRWAGKKRAVELKQKLDDALY